MYYSFELSSFFLILSYIKTYSLLISDSVKKKKMIFNNKVKAIITINFFIYLNLITFGAINISINYLLTMQKLLVYPQKKFS